MSTTRTSDAIVVDTHSLIWRFGDQDLLPEGMHAVFNAAERDEVRLLVPTIVLSELLHLYEGRMPQIQLEDILNSVLRIPAYTVVPYDWPVFEEARRLSSTLEMHDRISAQRAVGMALQ
jgi:predicted nucleic acid-binding protein